MNNTDKKLVALTIEDISPIREYPFHVCHATFDNGEIYKTLDHDEMNKFFRMI